MNRRQFESQATMMRTYAKRWRTGNEAYRGQIEMTVGIMTDFLPEAEKDALREIYEALKHNGDTDG